MTQRRRVAITGLGLVTPAGNDVAATWSALLAARSGVDDLPPRCDHDAAAGT